MLPSVLRLVVPGASVVGASVRHLRVSRVVAWSPKTRQVPAQRRLMSQQAAKQVGGWRVRVACVVANDPHHSRLVSIVARFGLTGMHHIVHVFVSSASC
jgi:hypothetical protein